MKKEIQELLEELLDFYAYRTPGPLLQKAYMQIERIDLYSDILKIFSWQSNGRMPSVKYDIHSYPLHQIEMDGLNKLFKACPEMTQIFKLENGVLKWTEKLSKTEIQDISDYLVKRAIPYFSGARKRRRRGRLP